MINIPPIKASSPVKPELLAEISKTWRIGQILSATTQQGGDALSKVLIQVGQHTLEAKTPVALQTGQDIKLLVKTLGSAGTDSQGSVKANNLPLLSIITPGTLKSGTTEQVSSQTININSLATSKLRQFIAVQQSFSQLQQVTQSLLSISTNQQKLPASLKSWLTNIESSLQFNNKSITVAQLKQHILNSGVFLESKLFKHSNASSFPPGKDSALVNDFKFQLLAIKAELAKFNSSAANQQLNTQTLSPVIAISPAQINQLKSDILNTGNRPDEIVNKLISDLPKPLLIQLSQLLTKPAMQATTADDLQTLVQAINQALQKNQQSVQKNLVDQLRFRLLLLDLGQQVEQSISKITSLQLQPLSREGDGLVLLLFNLIFKDSHEHFDMHFRIQEDESTSTTSDKENWEITLTFNFKTLGIVQSNIHLMENKVSTVFHTELASTAEKIHPLLPLLHNGFKNAGLEVLNIDIIKGLHKDQPLINTHINLLDENV